MDTSVQISSAAVSDRGLSQKRPHNEDSYLELAQRGIFAVADGVGGAQAGEVASQMAMDILGEAFANAGNGDAETVMRAAIERANSAIYDMAQELPQLSSMATTIVAVHLNGNIATIGHVGDSRVYRLDRDGEIHRETEDHSMVAEEVRAGRMTEEQAENHPSRNIISRALGAESTVEPDLKTIMVDAGTAFLLCSDGITRHVSDQEIKGVLTFGGTPADVCEYLKDLCFQRGAEDNLTAVVVRLAAGTGEVAAAPAPAESDDHPTIATARVPAAVADDDVLELGTGQLPATEEQHIDPELEHDTISFSPEETANAAAAASSLKVEIPPTEPAIALPKETVPPPSGPPRSSIAGTLLTGLAMLIVGGLAGIAAYHFLLAPRATETTTLPTEMRSSDVQLTAFEENRRSVDANPTAWIGRQVSFTEKCEDRYLLGRAYLQVGDYENTRAMLTQAQNCEYEDERNRRVITNDIAIMLTAISSTTTQTNLRKELGKPAAPAANANSQASP